MRAAYINQTNLTTDRVKCEDTTELDDDVHQVKTEPDDDVHQVKTETDHDVHQVKIEVRTSMTLAGTFSIHTFSSEYCLFFSILLTPSLPEQHLFFLRYIHQSVCCSFVY